MNRALRSSSIHHFILNTLLFIISGFGLSAQEENLLTLDRWVEWSDAEHMVVHHLNNEDLELIKRAFRVKKSSKNLHIIRTNNESQVIEIISEWME